MPKLLKDELLEMQQADQRLLQTLIDSGEIQNDEYHPQMKSLHEQNTARLKKIVNKTGWPKISIVGVEASKAAWLIAQHAILDKQFMSNCLSMLHEAVKENEAEGWCYAYLKDRLLVLNNEQQIYGTQFDVKDGNLISFPIKNPDQVNELRSELGLDSIEDAYQRVKKRYKVQNNG